MEALNELREQLQLVVNQLQASEERQRVYESQIATLNNNLNQFRSVQTEAQYEDIKTQITSPDQIQLESYKSIPEFSGNKGQYRSWRNQVVRRMKMIENCKTHPKYEAALGIIRAKITGFASDVLTNNKTAYNIDAIIERLDSSYADQRPLYVVEAEMTSIRQSGKTLQEYYDAINQALNMVISKIVMAYGQLDEQKSLINEAQQKAIRTFIVGLKSLATRNILYSHKPKTLAEAFTTAQTVYFDNQYLQLDQNREPQRYEQQKNPQRNQQQQGFPKKPYHGTQQQQQNPPRFSMNMNCNQPQQQPIHKDKPEPMEIDPSNRIKQTNWRQPYAQTNGPQKREYNSSGQHMQQPQKVQRINQLQSDESDPNEGYEGDICGDIPDDLISNFSHGTNETTESTAFLDE